MSRPMSASVAERPSQTRLRVFILCGAALYFLANVQRVAIPGAIFNLLQTGFDASAGWIAGLGPAFMYVYALNQLVVGFFVERHGGVLTILCGSVFFCAGSLLFPLAGGLGLLYASRILIGFGAGTIYLGLVKETWRAFPGNNFSVALSAVIFTGYAGGIMANAPFVIGVQALGWRGLMLALGVASLACWLLLLLTGSRIARPGAAGNARFSPRPFARLLADRANRDIILFTGMNFGLYYVLQTVIGKKFLEDYCAMPSGRAAWVLSLMAILSAVLGFLVAVFSRMIGNRKRVFFRIAGGVSAGSFASVALLLLLDLRTPLLPVLLCVLSATASTSALSIPLLFERNPPAQTGFAVSLLNFGLYFFVAVFGNGAGLLLECFRPEAHGAGLAHGRDAWLAIFAGLFLCSLFVLRFALRIPESVEPSGQGGPQPASMLG